MNIGEALINLGDIAQCVSGDMHTMHLNFKGAEFDTMHKKVLKKYYKIAGEDADSWYESAGMLGILSPSLNEAAIRLKWQSVKNVSFNRTDFDVVDDILSVYLDALLVLFNALGTQTECYNSIGIQNTVQTAIEYWSKEKSYFNARRIG